MLSQQQTNAWHLVCCRPTLSASESMRAETTLKRLLLQATTHPEAASELSDLSPIPTSAKCPPHSAPAPHIIVVVHIDFFRELLQPP